jgi:integrase
MTPRRRPWGTPQQRNGNWYAVYSPLKGSKRRVWERVYPNTRTRALDVLAQRQAELASGTWDDPTSILTFGTLAAEWFATMRGSWKPQTEAVYKSRLEQHALPYLADVDVRQIDGAALQRLATSMAPRQTRTIRCIIGTVKQVIRWGHEHSRIRTLPNLNVKLPPVPRSEVDPLTIKEARKLLDNAFEWRPMLMWALFTGMRQGEILAAKWENLNTERGTYDVRENLNRKQEFDTPKTGIYGTVEVPPPLLVALENQRTQVSAWELATDKWNGCGLIFPNRRHGGPNDHTVLVRAFRMACDTAGLRRRPFHHLRHTCASLLIDQGETVLTVAGQLRHKDASVTINTYSHLMPDAGKDALIRLAESVGV